MKLGGRLLSIRNGRVEGVAAGGRVRAFDVKGGPGLRPFKQGRCCGSTQSVVTLAPSERAEPSGALAAANLSTLHRLDRSQL